MRRCTDEMVEFYKANYMTMPLRQMFNRFGVSRQVFISIAKRLNLFPPVELRQQWLRDSYFKSGRVSWNNGLKGLNMGGKSTQFKKGHVAHNVKYDGAVSLRHNYKRDQVTLYIRTAPGNWELLNRYMWAKVYGAIPAGHSVRYRDGDQLNCNIENLECVSRVQHLNMNCSFEKRRQTAINNYKEGKFRTDKYYASLMTKDAELRKLFMKCPELIELKKKQLEFRRALRNG